jgi:hypothetical protein
VNLIWVPNQHLALLFLAFCRQNSQLGDFCIFVQDEAVIPELREMAEEMNVKFISRDATAKTDFQYFVIFSFGILSYQEEVRSSVKYEKLLIFGDHFNNAFYLHSSARDWDIHGLVFFGYELLDQSFISMDLRKTKETFVISLKLIADQVKDIQNRRKIRDYKEIINEQSHLILDRYWGSDSYRFTNWRGFERYLDEILQISKIPQNIIFKKVESSFSGSLDEKRHNRVTENLSLSCVDWESIVEEDPDFRYLTSPEALFLGDRIKPKSLFAFDGSTSLIGALSQSSLRVIWPDEVELIGVFENPFLEELVKEKSRIYREVIAISNNEHEISLIQVRTDGLAMREFIGRFIMNHYVTRLDALTQERDALTQERDALTQERDALTQERDALTQERDVLTQERDVLTQERDVLTQERDVLTQERDVLTQERDVLTQERDALTQERDALTQERDALTQERDALTQERDALTHSTIWRATRLLRALASKIKRLK